MEPERLFGDVASFDVSSRSMGDLGRSTLLPGLLSFNFLSINCLCSPAPGGEAPEAVAAAALSKCWRRPGLRPKKGLERGESKWGVGGLIRPAMGSLKPGEVEVALVTGLEEAEVVLVEAAGGEDTLAVAAAAAAAAISGLNMYSHCDK